MRACPFCPLYLCYNTIIAIMVQCSHIILCKAPAPTRVLYFCMKGSDTVNNENLIPNAERTPNELREITQKGGIASGKARRRNKLMRTMLKELLKGEVVSKKDIALLAEYGIDPDEANQAMLILVGLVKAAKAGNVRAVKQILELIGEDERLKIEREKLELMKQDDTGGVSEAVIVDDIR